MMVVEPGAGSESSDTEDVPPCSWTSCRSLSSPKIDCNKLDCYPVSTQGAIEEWLNTPVDREEKPQCVKDISPCEEKPWCVDHADPSYIDCTWEYAVCVDAFGHVEKWSSYSSHDSRVLETYWTRWLASDNRRGCGCQIETICGRVRRSINFADMVQTNSLTGKQRRLRRVVSARGHDTLKTETNKLTHSLQDVMGEQAFVSAAFTQVAQLSAELKRTKAQLNTATAEVARVHAELASLRSIYAQEMEIWKHQTNTDIEPVKRRDLKVELQSALVKLVPSTHHGECAKARGAKVTSVRSVVNMRLWKQYLLKRESVRDDIRDRVACPWATDVAPPVIEVAQHFPWIWLDKRSNEVLLLHGTSLETAKQIAKEGFDERLSRRGLYGRGIYLTTDFCKAAQYGGDDDAKCLIVTRAILGHPFMAEGPMSSSSRPPDVHGVGLPHDSIVAQPGIKKVVQKRGVRGNGRQLHYEFVVARGDLQLYPEFIVEFEIKQEPA